MLLSDDAPVFIDDVLRKLCNFVLWLRPSLKPSCNGAVELLKTVLDPTTVDWDMDMDDFRLTLNSTVNTSTGETFPFLSYGC